MCGVVVEISVFYSILILIFLLPLTDDKEELSVALNNCKWDVEQDAAVMAWATQQPADWQVGGRCHVYMWGSGRHGQLAETGNNDNDKKKNGNM